jgi:hypothetical protein
MCWFKVVNIYNNPPSPTHTISVIMYIILTAMTVIQQVYILIETLMGNLF